MEQGSTLDSTWRAFTQGELTSNMGWVALADNWPKIAKGKSFQPIPEK